MAFLTQSRVGFTESRVDVPANKTKGPSFRKLEKAVAISGIFSGVPKKSSRKFWGIRENLPESRNDFKFGDIGHLERGFLTVRELGSQNLSGFEILRKGHK